MSTIEVVEICLSEPYPVVLEQLGLSFGTYLAVRKEKKFPPRNNFARRNMKVRQQVVEAVHNHPELTYSEVAKQMMLPLQLVWKIFTD
jgi:hypothetical protein